MKKTFMFVMLTVVGCLFWALPPVYGFASLEHQFGVFMSNRNHLIKNTHKDHWIIGYRYSSVNCPVEQRIKNIRLEEAITTALQTWLRPLRDLPTEKPIVDDFRYQLVEDVAHGIHDHFGIELNGDLLKPLDLRVTFYCSDNQTRSTAILSDNPEYAPEIYIKPDIDHHSFKYVLTHELGHAMGLGDTYVGRSEFEKVPSKSTGGLPETVSTQPASVMGVVGIAQITDDDRNGIVWTYKVAYEDLPQDDCFFQNYRFEESPEGCVPKAPLLFELLQGHREFAVDVLKHDKNIDVNARDESDSTALHHAIFQGYTGIAITLLTYDEIWISPRNKDGKTPLDLAREFGEKKMIALLLKHPNRRLSVAPQGKLATMWGNLKRGD